MQLSFSKIIIITYPVIATAYVGLLQGFRQGVHFSNYKYYSTDWFYIFVFF